MESEVDVVIRLFTAVSKRDLPGLLDCYTDDVSIHEDAALPYGGAYRGLVGAAQHATAFANTWGRFQSGLTPGLDPRYVADGQGTVVVLFRHRARDARKQRHLDTPEIGIYRLATGKVQRSQMIHPDVDSLLGFLSAATTPDGRGAGGGRP